MPSTRLRSVSSTTGSIHFAQFLEQRLDSLATELARGKRERRLQAATTQSTNTDGEANQ